MAFSKAFPRTTERSVYPKWEEIFLTKEEEKEQEELSREENLRIIKQCVDDAKKIFEEKDLKSYQSDVISVAVALFEKRGSHTIFYKESKAKKKFDATYS
ncbi:MAG: hypothetical protein ACQESF_04040 [Nanobdellota archaeon]